MLSNGTDAGAALTQLVLEVFRANGALLSGGDALVADLGLSSARWQVLGAVALSEDPATVSSVARVMGLSRQAVQRVANDLAAVGLATYEDNPRHRRAKVIALSPEGARVYRAASARQATWAAALAEGLGVAAIDAATLTVRRMRLRLEGEADDLSAG